MACWIRATCRFIRSESWTRTPGRQVYLRAGVPSVPSAGPLLPHRQRRDFGVMGTRNTDAVLRGLYELAESHAQLTDSQLLSQFATDRDERAFAALLHRHGNLV